MSERLIFYLISASYPFFWALLDVALILIIPLVMAYVYHHAANSKDLRVTTSVIRGFYAVEQRWGQHLDSPAAKEKMIQIARQYLPFWIPNKLLFDALDAFIGELKREQSIIQASQKAAPKGDT